MPTPTFAEQMVTKLQEKLLAMAGVKSTDVDGENVDLTDLKKDWEFWKLQVARENGSKPKLVEIRIGES